MKKILSIICGFAIASSMLSAKAKGPTINLWSFTDEIPGIVEKYKATHPDIDFELKTKIVPTNTQEYQPALDPALQSGEVDIYAAESAFVLKYASGSMSDYAAPYKDLGIKTDKAIKDADIANYTVDIGKNTKGQVVGLGYQATGGCFIYNRTVAKEVFGSDDPKTVQNAIGGGSGSWEKFWDAAAKCAEKGYAIVSSDGDIWHAYENSSEKGWVVNNKLYIDPKREEFLEASKRLTENSWSNGTQQWTDAWYADMARKEKDTTNSAKPVLGFFGPAWLINYTMAPNSGGTKVGEGTYGDWAVCNSPIGFFWGGTWVLASKAAAKDKTKKAIIKDIIEWITLDTSNSGLLYQWANATFQWKYGAGKDESLTTKDTVSSGVVMSKSNGKLDFLGGQNMFDYFVPAGSYASGKNLTEYDEDINAIWLDQVHAYAKGDKTKNEAIEDFKKEVSNKFVNKFIVDIN